MPKSFDWAFGPGTSPTMGAINAAGLTAGASMVGALADVSPLWALTGGVAAAGIAGISAAAKEAPGVVAGYRAACWLGASSWSTYALATYEPTARLTSGPWSIGCLTALAIGGGVAAGVGTILRWAQQSQVSEKAKQALARKMHHREGEWEERIRRICRIPDVEIIGGPDDWPTGHGFTIEVSLGKGGHTWKKLATMTDALTSDAELPIGCGVEVGKGVVANRAILYIATSDALADEEKFPAELEPATINNSFSIGWHRDGSPAEISLRWTSAIMAGQRGSGKSNTLHAITGRLAQCTDVVLFHIAIAKKGALSAPWTRAYLEGRADYPVVDWVAKSEEEASAMCDVIDDLIDQRQEKLLDRMNAADDDKVPTGYSSADSYFIPEVVLMADEFAQLSPRLQRRITAIAEKGRGSSVATIGASQRAVAEHLPTSLKKQSSVRIGMKVQDAEELNYMFGFKFKIDLEDLGYEGCGLLGDGTSPPRAMRIYRMTPSIMDRIAVTCGITGRRSEIEPGMLAPETQKLYNNRRADAGASTPIDRPKPVSIGDIGRQTQKLAERIKQTAEDEKQRQIERKIEDLDALEEMWATPAIEKEVDERPPAQPQLSARERMMELLLAAGPSGSGSSKLSAELRAEGYPTSRQTVAGWLAEELAKGNVTQPGGDKTPYIHRDV